MKKQAQLYTFHMEFAVTLLMQLPNPISSYKDLSPEVILLDTNI